MPEKETEVFECCNCDREFPADEQLEDNRGNLYCEECADEYLVTCESCHEYVHPDDARSANSSREYYCDSCFEDLFVICSECNEVESQDDCIYFNDNTYCSQCADRVLASCNDCGELDYRDDMNWVEARDAYVCGGCYENNYFTCDNCHELFHNDDMHTDEDGDGCWCESCFNSSSESRAIHNYSYKPRAVFFRLTGRQSQGDSPNSLYFGVETEIELPAGSHYGDIAADFCDKAGDLFYCKTDGSLHYGFEIVTHPFTWEWMLKNKGKFDPMFDLRSVGATSYNNSTCGMHVHMSRAAFSHLQIMKFITMFYDFPDFTHRISRRTKSRLDCYATVEKPSRPMSIARDGATCGPRGALNFYNFNTIECRIFRGTLNPVGWFANMEYLQGLFEFCTGHGLADIKPRNFLAWMEDHEREFPNFARVHAPRLIQSAERTA